MRMKVLAVAAAALMPVMAWAQTDVAVENTGNVERPLAEGQVVPDINYVHTILWTDSGADAYDVYASEEAITDIGAANVFRVGTGIASGQQAWEHPLLTPFAGEVGDVTLFYAVVEAGGSAVTPGTNATTSGTSGTREWAQPFFWFTEEPFIDGDFSDWPFEPVTLDPESPDNFFAGELDGRDDMSGQLAMGVDANNVYMRVETTDDLFVNTVESGDGSIWQGDAVEFYLGYYDMRPSDLRHPLSQFGNESDPSAAEPDWQLAIAGNAFDNPQRSHSYDGSAADNAGSFNRPLGDVGLEVLTGETGDGWFIEASLPHAGMQFEPSLLDVFQPWVGLISPATYVLNDGDDPAGGRQAQVFWSKDEAVNNAWNTPSSWEKQHVIYDPKVFGLGGGGGTAVEESSWGAIKSGMGQ
ncbi:MAG: hypothetical protein GKR89_10240 [Candidatus Latescibacteria bacterium]|nr:hypothetical protein [Candidatus Latescibacterota bacterium]